MCEQELSITEDDLKTRPFDPANYLNSFNEMQKFLTNAIKKRKTRDWLCEAFKVVVRAGCLNNPEKKEYFIEESEPLLQEGTPEALRKVADVLGLKVPSNFGKPTNRNVVISMNLNTTELEPFIESNKECLHFSTVSDCYNILSKKFSQHGFKRIQGSVYETSVYETDKWAGFGGTQADGTIAIQELARENAWFTPPYVTDIRFLEIFDDYNVTHIINRLKKEITKKPEEGIEQLPITQNRATRLPAINGVN